MSDPNLMQAAMGAQSAGRMSPGMSSPGMGMSGLPASLTIPPYTGLASAPTPPSAPAAPSPAASGQGGFMDMKGPLANFAAQMLLQKMNPQVQPMQPPPTVRMWG